MALRYIGTIIRGHGIKGEILVGDTKNFHQNIPENIKIRIGYSQKFTKEFSLLKSRKTKHGIIISLKEISTPEQGDEMKEQGVFVEENFLREAEKEEYFLDEIIGSEVFDAESNLPLGKIIDVWQLPANDVWVMLHDGREIPVPVIKDVVRHVDAHTKKIYVTLMEGLLDLDKDEERDDQEDEE